MGARWEAILLALGTRVRELGLDGGEWVLSDIGGLGLQVKRILLDWVMRGGLCGRHTTCNGIW